MWGRLSCLVVIVGCSHPEGPSELAPLPPEIDAMPADPGGAVLLDPGSGETHTLRYAPKIGTKREVDIEMTSTTLRMYGDVENPTMTLHGAIEVMSAEHHVFSVRLSFDRADAQTGDEVIADLARGRLRHLIGAVAVVRYTELGQPLEVDPPSTTSKRTAAALHQVAWFATSVLRVPQDAVGAGARWRAEVPGPDGRYYPAELDLVDVSRSHLEVAGPIAHEYTYGDLRIVVAGEIDAAVDLEALTGSLRVETVTEALDQDGVSQRARQTVSVQIR